MHEFGAQALAALCRGAREDRFSADLLRQVLDEKGMRARQRLWGAARR